MPHPMGIHQDVTAEEHHKGRHTDGDTKLTDELGQLVELDVQRSLHRCHFGAALGHLSNFRGITHGSDQIQATPVHHHRASQHFV